MGRSCASGLVLRAIMAMAMAMVVVTMAERVNKSGSGGLFWSTAKEEGDLLPNPDPYDDSRAAAVVGDHDELDGGFSSLDGMLQWAIGHSDPLKLKETAQDVQRLSPAELKKRQLEIKALYRCPICNALHYAFPSSCPHPRSELMEKLKMPSVMQLMKIAIDDLNNLSLSLEDRHRALEELLIFVEPIDNAHDLNKLGGIGVILRELSHPDDDIRIISAWILGKASQNNPLVQKQVLELGGLSQLMEMVKSSVVEEATKALYAVSALIRNNFVGQEMFYADAGDLMLQDLLSNPSSDIRLLRKAVFLISDLAESQIENMGKAEPPIFSNPLFLKSVIDLTVSTDLDLQEKALVAIKNLLQLRSIEALGFKDFCGLDGALEKLRQQLQALMVEEYIRDYAMDLESLRKEVELIFRRKLGKVGTVA